MISYNILHKEIMSDFHRLSVLCKDCQKLVQNMRIGNDVPYSTYEFLLRESFDIQKSLDEKLALIKEQTKEIQKDE